MKKSIKDIFVNIIIPVFIIILAIVSIFVPIFFSNASKIERRETVFTTKAGNKFVGYDVDVLQDANSLTYVNHYPGEYVKPKDLTKSGKIEKVDNLTPAKFGTLQFVIFNYDKNDPSFHEKLNQKKIFKDAGSNNNVLLLYLPFAADAATVWTEDNYYRTYGKMKDYDISNYSEEGVDEVKFSREPISLECVLTMNEDEIAEDRMESARILTIHYQSKHGLTFANNIPIMGEISTVARLMRVKFNTTSSVLSIMIALIVAFIGLILLKSAKKHIPVLGIAFSELMLLVAQFVSLKYTIIQGKMLTLTALSILSIFAMLACKPKYKVVYKYWLVGFSASLINFLVTNILIFTGSILSIKIYCQVSSLLLVLINFVFIIITIREMSSVQFIAILIALATPIVSLYFNYSILSTMHPSCWLLGISAVIILWHIFNDVLQSEKRNQRLTKNLKAEVATQTKNLEDALEDREMLISFISHDLRKSSVTIDSLATNLMLNGKGDEIKLAGQIKDKNQVLLDSFSEISKYMKQNYSDEAFSCIKVQDIFDTLKKTIGPDCEANGINLTFGTSGHVISAKRNALMSVLGNLIFNAIEHAECENISVTAKKHRDMLDIFVHDDGKGIATDKDIFSPYKTGDDEENNMGLGLFIVKSKIEEQGGSISYKADKGSTFIVSLMLCGIEENR